LETGGDPTRRSVLLRSEQIASDDDARRVAEFGVSRVIVCSCGGLW